MPNSEQYGSGTTPQRGDSQRMLLVKEVLATVAGGGGGGGGTTQVFFGSGDPNGVQTATRPALFYTAAGAVWIKTGTGTNSTGWEERL